MSGKAVLGTLLCAGLLLGQQAAVESAWQLLGRGERKAAVQALHRILSEHPDNVDARLLLGSILTEDGEGDEALSQLKEAVRLRPGSAEAHHALAEAYHAFEQPERARKEYERTIAINPTFPPAQAALGEILFQAREFPAAAQHLDRALQLLGSSPDAAEPHYLRAKVDSEANELRHAIAHLESAVSLRPDFAEAWSDLGQARRSLQDHDGAKSALMRAVSLAPRDAVAHYRLGAEYLAQNQAHLAVAQLQEAFALNPEDQSTLYALQSALRQDGQADAARKVKEQLTALLRRRDEAAARTLAGAQLNNQGVAFEKSGNLRAALEKYRAALELCPEHAGFRVNYAAALLHLGRADEGIAELREALRRNPSDAVVKAALEKAQSQVTPR